jgi:hypothetical protein
MVANTHYTDSQNSDTTASSGRELYHFQFSLQAASPETFGDTLVLFKLSAMNFNFNCFMDCDSVPIFTIIDKSLYFPRYLHKIVHVIRRVFSENRSLFASRILVPTYVDFPQSVQDMKSCRYFRMNKL